MMRPDCALLRLRALARAPLRMTGLACGAARASLRMTGRAPLRMTGLAGALLASACTSGQVGGAAVSAVDPYTQAKLQFAVGVATYQVQAGEGLGYITRHDLNLVETLRNPDGTSGVLVNTPAITGPANYVAGLANNGYDGAGTNQIFKSLKGLPALGYGFGALIESNGGLVQTLLPQQVGGPPAWPGIVDSQYPANFGGFGLGYIVFPPQNEQDNNIPTTAVAGSYNLTVAETTDPGTLGYFPVGPPPANSPSVNAGIRNANGLPLIMNGPTFTPDGKGGGTFQLAIPAGVTESIVIVETANQCYTANGLASGPGSTVFAVVSTQPGPANVSYILPSNLGPPAAAGNGHTLCTAADNLKVGVTTGTNIAGLAIEADYPLYEASYPLDRQQMPQIIGPSGQSDVSFGTFSDGNYP